MRIRGSGSDTLLDRYFRHTDGQNPTFMLGHRDSAATLVQEGEEVALSTLYRAKRALVTGYLLITAGSRSGIWYPCSIAQVFF